MRIESDGNCVCVPKKLKINKFLLIALEMIGLEMNFYLIFVAKNISFIYTRNNNGPKQGP